MSQEYRNLIYSLKVPGLKEVLKSFGLPISGLKKDLQTRLENHAVDARNSGNTTVLETLCNRCRNVLHPGSAASSPATTPVRIRAVVGTTPQMRTPTSGGPTLGMLAAGGIMPKSGGSTSYANGWNNFDNVQFKPSPFYTFKERIAGPKQFEARLGVGFSELQYELTAEQYGRLHVEGLQVLFVVVSTAEANSGKPAAVVYPPKASLHFGNMEVPRKFQGLKGKPWTATPADLTPFTKKAKKNVVQIKFDVPSDKYDGIKRYVMFVYIAKRIKTTDIVEEIKRTKFKTKEEVLKLRQQFDADDDIEATSEEVSLKDKATLCRIDTPARSTHCHHVQCFDLSIFFSLMETYPTFECTACNKQVPWESIFVDG
ncbi:SUMO ligase siz1 [Rhizophlyctis rosea]|nr:SUMO ligase siz1 [Rhizophlyctis rosea]